MAPKKAWRTVKKAALLQNELDEWTADAKCKAKAQEAAASMARRRSVVVDVADQETLASIPKWMQGNADLNTEEALHERLGLRRDKAVLETLDALWLATMRTAMRARNELLAGQPGPTARRRGSVLEFGLNQDEYVSYLLRLFRLLVPDVSADEAARTAQDDWDADRKERPSITRELFMDAMFELIDHWTESISASEYAAFGVERRGDSNLLFGGVHEKAAGKHIHIKPRTVTSWRGSGCALTCARRCALTCARRCCALTCARRC